MKKNIFIFYCILFSGIVAAQPVVPFSVHKPGGEPQDSLYGFKTPGGKVVVKPIYSFLDQITSTGYFRATVADANPQSLNNNVLINPSGETVSRSAYVEIHALGHGYFEVMFDQSKDRYSPDELAGVIDSLGNPILSVVYGSVKYLQDSQAFLVSDKASQKLGIVDITGNVLVRLQYDVLLPQPNGFFYVEMNKKAGLIDLHNYVIIPITQDYLHRYRNFYFASIYPDPNSRKSETRIYNPQQPGINGYVYEDFQFWRISRKQPDLTAVEREGKWGFLDTLGKEAIPAVYDTVAYFDDGGCCTMVMKNKKVGMINRNNEPVIPIKYDGLYFPYNEKRLPVALNGKYGFLDETGAEIIPAIYEQAGRFENGKAQVQLNGRSFYIDVNGKEVQ